MARRSIGAEADSGHQVRCAASLAQFALTSVEPQARLRQVKLAIDIGVSTDIPVDNDGSALQILTNLLLNSIEFTPEDGEVKVSIRRSGRGVTFCVRDEGPGVAPEVARELFGSVVSTRKGGAGIGLPFSRTLARKCGGELRLVPAEESKSQGACFELTWPGSRPLTVAPGQSSPFAEKMRGARILVIEDDISILSLIELGFQAHGAEVITLSNPDEVEETLQGRPVFDAALVDLSPIKSRLVEVLARLRHLAPHAPIVLVSGEPTGVPDEANGRFAAWVRKPFDMGELLNTVSNLLKQV
jgi:CheY-like chemotaxis protein